MGNEGSNPSGAMLIRVFDIIELLRAEFRTSSKKLFEIDRKMFLGYSLKDL